MHTIMTTKIKWRLAKLPTPEEVTLLLNEDVITKEEAREILISLETDEDRDRKSLQDEILFLRQLVHSLSNRRTIVETIRSLPNERMPWNAQHWYKPYEVYCDSLSVTSGLGSSAAYSLSSTSNNLIYQAEPALAFSDIKTF